MKLDSGQWEGVFVTFAVLLVLFTAMWDPMISFVLSLAALVSVGVVAIAKKAGYLGAYPQSPKS
jgi:hypothetical protein